MKSTRHLEKHYSQRIGWLRAAVLGANDGIVSTASLLVGVAAAGTSRSSILVAGVAGLVAGAMSMAAGEYVSVSSQADTEQADLARERAELRAAPAHELEELRQIYVARGLDPDLALKVAKQLMERDALGAHARDELGLSIVHTALPLILAAVVSLPQIILAVPAGSLFSLAALGALSAKAGGAGRGRAVLRVTFWGALAMALTAAIGRLFGTVV